MELLTVPEVAQRLRISKSLAYLLCQRGTLPAIRLGTSIRVPAGSLEQWLSEQVRASGARARPGEERDGTSQELR